MKDQRSDQFRSDQNLIMSLYPQKTLALRDVSSSQGMIPEHGAVLDYDRIPFVPTDSVDVFHGLVKE